MPQAPYAGIENGASTAGLSAFPPGSEASSQTGGKRRKTRKAIHNNRRKTYKQRGGDDSNAKGLRLGTERFILYKNGTTSSFGQYDTTRIPFNERVKTILNSFEYKFHTDENPYSPLGDIKSNVITRMLTIANILKKQKDTNEGTSPAQYRAYILATHTEERYESGKSLKISFCEDIWSNKQVTRILPYALLDALFKDKLGDDSEAPTVIEYKKIVDQFIIHNMMKQGETGSANTFSDLQFTSAQNDLLPQLCSTKNYLITNPLYIETLMKGHTSLRDLYDVHMQTVIQFITTKLITPKFRGYKEPPQWTMNSIFANDSRGALATLESIIKEARTMLVKHYFATESVYVSTLEKIKEMASGLKDVPSNPLTNSTKNETSSVRATA